MISWRSLPAFWLASEKLSFVPFAARTNHSPFSWPVPPVSLSLATWVFPETRVTPAGSTNSRRTGNQVRARTACCVWVELVLPAGVTLVSGKTQVASERLTGGTGQLKGEWLVRAAKGTKLTFSLASQNAGRDRQEITLQ